MRHLEQSSQKAVTSAGMRGRGLSRCGAAATDSSGRLTSRNALTNTERELKMVHLHFVYFTRTKQLIFFKIWKTLNHFMESLQL